MRKEARRSAADTPIGQVEGRGRGRTPDSGEFARGGRTVDGDRREEIGEEARGEEWKGSGGSGGRVEVGRDSKNSICKSLVEKRRDDNVKNTSKEASSRRSGRAQNTLSRSVSVGAIRGGKLALKRLLDLHSYSADTSSLANAEIEFESLLSKEKPDFELLQRDIVKMEMSGNEAKGAEILKKALEKARKEEREGNIEEALKCKCLEDEVITDARRPLYQASHAIIQYLSGHPEKQVEETFNRFREIQIGLQWPGSSEECETHEVTFDEFKKVLESLKSEIQDSTKINIENSTPLDKQH
uniref:Uncharacterized protein n=1 Tax=Brassica oleracea var. oleracea TaxID=109376 RepID=A0A0D3C451_BRAOL